MSERNEQKLIDLTFEFVMALKFNQPWLAGASQEQLAEWVAHHLAAAGFHTRPCGMSWGVLCDPPAPDTSHCITIVSADRPE